jgi:hypothetical protein
MIPEFISAGLGTFVTWMCSDAVCQLVYHYEAIPAYKVEEAMTEDDTFQTPPRYQVLVHARWYPAGSSPPGIISSGSFPCGVTYLDSRIAVDQSLDMKSTQDLSTECLNILCSDTFQSAPSIYRIWADSLSSASSLCLCVHSFSVVAY